MFAEHVGLTAVADMLRAVGTAWVLSRITTLDANPFICSTFISWNRRHSSFSQEDLSCSLQLISLQSQANNVVNVDDARLAYTVQLVERDGWTPCVLLMMRFVRVLYELCRTRRHITAPMIHALTAPSTPAAPCAECTVQRAVVAWLQCSELS